MEMYNLLDVKYNKLFKIVRFDVTSNNNNNNNNSHNYDTMLLEIYLLEDSNVDDYIYQLHNSIMVQYKANYISTLYIW